MRQSALSPHPPVTVFGVESSCDETACAIVRLSDQGVEVLADEIATQIEDHALYGGVVPEIAARAHVERIGGLARAALKASGLGWGDLDAVAATAGPGLIGGVMAGLSAGKGLALALGKPLIAVNHLEGHALSPRLSEAVAFPYLLLLVSGGHCQFLAVMGLGDYRRLGSTIDDAAGEAFDKTAKLLGLGFPGGPAVERAAASGGPARFALPRPLLDRPGLEMSFAGLKTAVRRIAETEGPLDANGVSDLCAGFQAAVGDVLAEKTRRALASFGALAGCEARTFVVAGGVAANRALRARLEAVCIEGGWRLVAPPLRHCTDNAAMIALAGAERLRAGLVGDGLAEAARPRWPLDGQTAAADPVYGAGRKGAKA